jgi:hypothetical protein
MMTKEWQKEKEVWKIRLNQSDISELAPILNEENDIVVEIIDLNQKGVDIWLNLVESQVDRLKSLILVVDEGRIGMFGDEEIPMAPTYLEALDLLDMERIQRELGL